MSTMESKNYFLFKIECWSQYKCFNFQQNGETLKESRASKAWLCVEKLQPFGGSHYPI